MENTAHLHAINLLQCEPDFATPTRVLETHYCLYVHQGSGAFQIGPVTYHAKMGDIFYCPPGVENAIFADHDTPFLLSGLDFSMEQEERGSLHLASVLNLSKNSFLIMCIREMVQEYRYQKTDSAAVCDHYLSALLIQLTRMSVNQNADQEDVASQLLDYLIHNYNQNITHKQLSELFSYQKSSINRILKKSTNMTLKNYLIEIRIKKACEYLAYSNKSLSEIADLCGYSSSAFFSRQFSKKKGITPLEYRKSHK